VDSAEGSTRQAAFSLLEGLGRVQHQHWMEIWAAEKAWARGGRGREAGSTARVPGGAHGVTKVLLAWRVLYASGQKLLSRAS